MREPVILTNEELRARCDEWQRLLRLQDWTVVVKRVRASEYRDGASLAGRCEFNVEKRAAIVKLTEPEDYQAQANKDFEAVQDMELTLVHELLHLYFAPLNRVIARDSLEERFEENAVHALADALVGLKRSMGIA